VATWAVIAVIVAVEVEHVEEISDGGHVRRHVRRAVLDGIRQIVTAATRERIEESVASMNVRIDAWSV